MKLGPYDISEYPDCYLDYDAMDSFFSGEVNPERFYSKNIEWRYCIIGNIIPEHIDAEGIVRYGTRAFPGGRKVYLSKTLYPEKGSITALGLSRHKNRFTDEQISIDLVDDIRLSKTYSKKLLEYMNYFEHAHAWWGNTNKEKKRCMEFISVLNECKSLRQADLL